MKYKFNPIYCLLFVTLFIIETIIAVDVKDNFIRPYGGDFLVVILVYCFVKSLFQTPLGSTLVGVLLFSYLIETLQYFHIINSLGLQDNTIARAIIGTYFTWTDILMYTIGILFVCLLEITLIEIENNHGHFAENEQMKEKYCRQRINRKGNLGTRRLTGYTLQESFLPTP